MMLQKVLMIGCFLILNTSFSYGEIEKIVLSLSKGACKETCIKVLEKKLLASQEIAELRFDKEELVLRWKPGRQFNYRNLYRLLKGVGVEVVEALVTVRGTLHHNNYSVTLTSIGDNTPFVVLSPAETSEDQTTKKSNSSSSPTSLQESTKAELIAAESQHKIVRIEGPLFEPAKSTPLKIVALTITIPQSL